MAPTNAGGYFWCNHSAPVCVNKAVGLLLNLVSWLALVLVVFCGCFFVASGLGALVTKAAPGAQAVVSVGVWVVSFVTSPVALAVVIRLFGRK